MTPSPDYRALLDMAVEALGKGRDFIIGLGQSPDAEGWPRDPYAVVAQIEETLATIKQKMEGK